MQLSWLWRGVRSGVVTTRYPDRAETMPSGWRGVALLDAERCQPEGSTPPCVRTCLSGALFVVGEGASNRQVRLDAAACIACGLCVGACPQRALSMSPAFELAARSRARLVRGGETDVASRS
jgi:formate hydrogenlyase subunit 6/NADH:ubiquinone oxidoreductase subunit I